MLLAHITVKNGTRIEQTLKDHSVQTAKYSQKCLESSGLGQSAYLAGLLHDFGKATKKFNTYLEAGFEGKNVVRGSVNHTFAGCIYLWEKYHKTTSKQMECLTSEILCCAIGGHHGLFDCVDFEGKSGFCHRIEKDRKELCYEEAAANYLEQVADEKSIDELFQCAVLEITGLFEKIKLRCNKQSGQAWFQISMFVRMLQSAVIYGDRRDTREFMMQNKQETVCVDWSREIAYYEEKIGQFNANSMLNQVRTDISDQCKQFAENPTGIYQLNVPTGGGKTLSVLRYALWHAKEYQKKKIIFIIPLLSVLDQNAKVIRDHISDSELILEHHSNVVREREIGDELDQYEVLTQSWESPIVISTLVQLLDILFKHHTSNVARMQALCDSVIVIDEVQSLPVKMTAMFNMALNYLSDYCNATIILSSATQPTFDNVADWPLHLAKKSDMVCLEQDQLSAFKRSEIVDFTNPYGMDWEECAAFCEDRMEEHSSLLFICNTKAEARTLFEMLKERNEDYRLFHLSTSMCQEHRTETLQILQKELKDLQYRLKEKQAYRKIICISTQLVEAGVDFSFECVVRVLAGIDNLAQAAGRCNRSNEYESCGKVYLINLKNENLSLLKEIKRAQDSTSKVLMQKDQLDITDLLEARSVQEYYHAMFESAGNEKKYPISECGKTIYLTELLSRNNSYADDKIKREQILDQPFKTVGKKFQVFENDSMDIIVPYRQGKELIRELREMEESSEKLYDMEHLDSILKMAKKYTISIFKYQKEKLDENGYLYHLFEGRVVVLDEDAYHKDFGLQNYKEKPVESYIL